MYLKQIEQLVVLQKVDGEIISLRSEIEGAPQEVATLEKRLAELTTAKESVDEKISYLNDQYKRLDIEIEDDSLKLKKSKSKLMQVGNTREYHAMMREMDSLDKQNRVREEERVALNEELERQQQALAEAQEKLGTVETELTAARASLADRVAAAEVRLQELGGTRAGACDVIPKPVLSRYEFIRSRLANPVIVAVNAGICQGCNIAIPPQTFIELQKGQQILSCPNCQRLIYWSEHFNKPEQEGEKQAAE